MIKPKNEGPSYLIDDALVKIEREQGMNRRTFVKGGVALAAMLAMGGAMGTYAWFTGSEVKENKTSIAENLEIEVVEPNFPESGIVENIVPGAVIPKDPAVINKSDVLNGYLFTEIRVPIAEVLVEGSEVAERLPLFSFESNDGWKLLQGFEDGDEKVFRYGWTEVVEHGGQTGSVFDTVTFVNLTGSAQGLDVGEQLVKVIGYGIQDTEAFEGDVAKAWNAYKLQNGITDGEPAGTIGRVDIVLNTNYIKEGETFDLARNELTNVVATTECVDEGSITFKQIPVVLDEPYSILPSGLESPTVEDRLCDVMFDEATLDSVLGAGSVVLESEGEVFAVWSATDKSLRFYNRPGKPSEGDEFLGRTATKVWTGFESVKYTVSSKPPWTSLITGLPGVSVEVVDLGIKPSYLDYWFYGFTGDRLDVCRLDTSCTTSMICTFRNQTSNLDTIDLSTWDVSQVTNMNSMFNMCNCKMLDLSTWSTQSLQSTISMFDANTFLETIYVGSDWNMQSVTDASYMFHGCYALVGGAGTECMHWNADHEWNLPYACVDNPPDAPGYFTLKL